MAPTAVITYKVEQQAANLNTLVTPSFTPAAGEVIVVIAIGENEFTKAGTITGGGLTWTLRSSSTLANNCSMYLWTAVVGASPSAMTVSVPWTGTSGWHRMDVSRRSNAALAATPAIGSAAGSSTCSATVACTGTDSEVIWAAADWAANSPGTPTYRSGSALNAGTYSSAHYTIYTGTSPNAAPGSKTIGISFPTNQSATLAGVEVLSAGPTVQPAAATVAGAGSVTAGAVRQQGAAATVAGAGSVSAASGAVPGTVLNIGPGGSQNHFSVQTPPPGGVDTHDQNELAAGYAVDPYFLVNQASGAVQFRAPVDGPTTPGSDTARTELRQLNPDGSPRAFDPLVGTTTMQARLKATHLSPTTPAVVMMQLHNGTTGDRISIRTQLISNVIKLLARVNGTQAIRFSEDYTGFGTNYTAGAAAGGPEFECKVVVRDGGYVDLYYQDMANPVLVGAGPLVSTGSASWYWKGGCYNQANASTEPAGEYFAVEMRLGTGKTLLVEDSVPGLQAAATVAGAGAVTAGAVALRAAAAVVAGAGFVTAVATQGRTAQATVAGAGAVTAGAVRNQAAAATVAGAGAMSATARLTQMAQATVAGAGQMQAVAGSQAAATVAGAGVMSATARQGFAAQAAVAGAGVMLAGARQGFGAAATVAGAGVVVAGASRGQPAAATVAGAGAVSALGVRVHNVQATVAGQGTVTAGGYTVRRSAATVAGAGRVTATATVLSLLNASLWVVDRATQALTPLPHWVKLNVSPIRNSPGAISVEYPVRGRGFDLLRAGTDGDGTDVEVEVWLGGSRAGARRALLMQTEGEDLDARTTWTFSGMFLERLLAEGIVGPQTPPTGSDKVDLVFTTATVGTIVATVLQQCQARGALTAITRDFTTSVDSGGVSWSTPISITFATKTTLLAVLQRLASYGLCEFSVTAGRVLQVWRPEGRGIDRSTLNEPPMFRHRRILDASRRHTVLDSPTAALGVGKDGVYAWVSDATAQARRGRRIETGVDVGELSDTGSVQAAAQRQLATDAPGQTELIYSLAFGVGDPVPGRGFEVGDWVSCDVRQIRERLRVVQWTLTLDREHGASGSATMNDLLADRRQRLQAQLDAIAAGAVVIGTSNPPDGPDTTAPSAPTGVNANSLAYADGAGGTLASVLVSWAEVTTNPGPPPVATDDVAGYRVEYSYTAAPGVWNLGRDVDGGSSTSTSFGDLQAGAQLAVRVKAYDRTGNTSAASATFTLTTETDDTAPPVPSTPVVTPYLGQLRVAWDGLGSAGEAMPLDLDYVELHVSPAAGFTPSSATVKDFFSTIAGERVITDLDYGVTQYVRLVAVDRTSPTPNKSLPSAVGSATPAKVVNIDIGPNAVGALQIIDLQVKTAKIDLLAVNDAQFGAGSFGKLLAGTITVAVTNAGIIRSGISGKRYELDAAALRLYNASGTQTVQLDGALNFITGEIRTAMSGARIVMNSGQTNPAEIRVFGASSGATQYGSINAATSNSPVYPDQAGIIMKGNSKRSDGASGEVTAFPDLASMTYADELHGGTVYSRVAAEIQQVGMSGARVQLSSGYDTGFSDQARIRLGVANPNSGGYYPRSILVHEVGPGGTGDPDSANPRWVSPDRNIGFQFDTQIMSVIFASGGVGPIQASAFTVGSERRLKTDIEPLDLDPVTAIRAPIQSWSYVDDPTGQRHLGAMAEDLPEAVLIRTEDGAKLSHGSYLALAVAALQRLADRVERLEARP